MVSGGTREDMRHLSTISMLLAVLALGACGDDDKASEADTTATPAEQTKTTAADSAATDLAQQTRQLQEDVTASARSLAQGSDAERQRARTSLKGQEQRARQLAADARALPDADVARDTLVRANEATVTAARELRSYTSEDGKQAIERARTALQRGQQQLSRAADALLGTAPANARKQLEDARKKLPDLPSTSDLLQR